MSDSGYIGDFMGCCLSSYFLLLIINCLQLIFKLFIRVFVKRLFQGNFLKKTFAISLVCGIVILYLCTLKNKSEPPDGYFIIDMHHRRVVCLI